MTPEAFVYSNPPFVVKLDNVNPANVGEAPTLMFCGRERVTAPVAPDTVTWFTVPANDVTPVLVMVTPPVA